MEQQDFPQTTDINSAFELAVLMTCHNRKETTLECLKALEQQKNINFNVYLVDDGSTDGTYEAVSKNYPSVNILQGDGNLFWVGGMRLAFAEALKTEYDYYLWLNDDTILETGALATLLKHHRDLKAQGNPDAIVVGSTKDPFTGKPTYGGAKRTKLWYSKKFEFVEPAQELQECETMYGNCVLIPNSVACKVGNIDPAFIHTMGDVDYGLRARQLGCSIWAAPEYVGICTKNSVAGSWADTNTSVYTRFKKALQPKGFPLKPWTIFCQRYSGTLWFIYWLFPYVRAVIGYRNLSKSSSFQEN